MERRLDKMPPWLLARIHASRGLGDQLRSLIMFIENQDEILRRLAVTIAEFVNPLDGFAKDRSVESVRVMDTWRLGLRMLEDEAIEALRDLLNSRTVVELSWCRTRVSNS